MMSTVESKKNHISEIDIEGFKIQIEDLIKKDILPEYCNAPLIGLWEITRACNLRCIHCYNNSGKKLPNELLHEEKISVAKQIVEAKILRMCISGGEPILCDSFWEIAKILKEGHVLCNTITNGSYINEDNADKYAKNFKYIQVSIDGANPKTHDKIRGKKGSWEKAINAVKLLIENKGLVSIATVVSSLNINELGQINDLIYDLGAKEFRIDLPIFVGQAAINYNSLALSKNQLKKFEKIISEKKKEYESKEMYIETPKKILKSYTSAFSRLPQMFCYISPSGTCAPSSAIPFSGGSIKEKSLKEIWNELKICHKNKDFLELSRTLRTKKDFFKLEEIPYLKGELHDK